MENNLTDIELRVLGCLIEKESTTPDAYPLTLNSLKNACNQKTNRDPVVDYDEQAVQETLWDLKEKLLVSQTNLDRVPKYRHLFSDELNLIKKESAVFCVLMLRGPQTAGELRSRTERLYKFDTLEMVNDLLSHLEELQHVEKLSRQPGKKEIRYAHCFGTSENLTATVEEPPIQVQEIKNDRIEQLENQVESLTEEMSVLKKEFNLFKDQF